VRSMILTSKSVDEIIKTASPRHNFRELPMLANYLAAKAVPVTASSSIPLLNSPLTLKQIPDLGPLPV
jgi:hypothetical protein